MRALKTKLGRNAQNGSADARYTNLIVQLKDLENINRIYLHYIDWLRSSWSNVRLPTLFSEIFDIPISSKSSSSSAISESIGDESLVNDLEESGGADESAMVLGMKEHRSSMGNESGSKTAGGDMSDGEMNSRTPNSQSELQQNHHHHHHQDHLDQHLYHHHDQDFFFNLASFRDTDDKIDAADLNPTVDCLDVVDQLTSQ